MELSSAIFRDVLSPIAAFKDISLAKENGVSGRDKRPDGESHESAQPTTSTQTSTPKTIEPSPILQNLQASVSEPTHKYKWTVQGADPDGRRFFAIPQFAFDKPPLRIDVYLPPLEGYDVHVQRLLRPEQVIYTSRDKIPELTISRWLAGVLQRWTLSYGEGIATGTDGKFEREYGSMPFGSRILVTSGGLIGPGGDIDIEIYLVPDYDVEQGMLSVDALKGMWGNFDNHEEMSRWPEIIDLEELRLKRQIHEAISIVTISHSDDNKEWVFKSLTRDQRYLYNELKMFLTVQPHENIISRPRYIVTKKGRFGGRKGVCGFILEYYTRGTLKQFLLESCGGDITMQQKLLWARQVTSALSHINSHSDVGFYPDLKPDNIVLRKRASLSGAETTPVYDAILLDLEQRGGWFSWSPPEVAYLEYLEILATSLAGEEGPEDEELFDLQEEIAGQLKEYYSVVGTQGWTPGSNSHNGRYFDSDGGFSAPWLALLAKRKAAVGVRTEFSCGAEGSLSKKALDLEKAQVFMLGKLLWCIFEEEGLLRCGIDHELLQDPVEAGRKGGGLKGFPEFEKTPDEIRELIKRCTAGAGEWEDDNRGGWRVVLNTEGKLIPAEASFLSNWDLPAEYTQRVAAIYWKREVERASEFVTGVIEKRKELKAERADGGCRDNDRVGDGIDGKGEVPSLLEEVRSRPTLFEVLDKLERISEYYGS